MIPSTSSHIGLVWVNSPFSTGLERLWGEISGLGVYSSLCELVEGIVTVPHA